MAISAGKETFLGYSQDRVNPIFCHRAIMTTSSGIWIGDNPLNFTLPTLIFQIVMVFFIYRATHAVFRLFGQPIHVSQIVAGIILGPSILSRDAKFAKSIVSQKNYESVVTISIITYMLFFFVIGVKADLGVIPKVGKKAVAIAIFSTLLPIVFIYITALCLRHKIPPRFIQGQLILLLTDTWCITSYPVLSCLLSELNLLSSKLGRLAMSATLIAAIVHVIANSAIVTYQLAIKIGNPLQGVTALVSFFALMGLILLVLRPIVLWLIRRTPEGALLDQVSFVAVVTMAMACGMLSQMIGFDLIVGPFFFGLVLPGGPPLGSTLAERMDRLVMGLFLPMSMAFVGIRTDLTSVVDIKVWWLFETFVLVITVAKFVGVILPCLYCRMPPRETVSLGLMLSAKGLSEVYSLIMWAENFVRTQPPTAIMHACMLIRTGKHVASFSSTIPFLNKHCNIIILNTIAVTLLERQEFSMVVITILILGGITTPLIKYLYRPEDRYVAHKRRTLQHANPGDELRVLTCVHLQDNVKPIITLLEASGTSPDSPICTYLIHLIQLVGRTDTVLHPHKRHNHSSSATALSETDHIVNAFRLFEQEHPDGLSVLPYVCISPYNTMHDDICSLALDKKVTLVILPFHKSALADGSISFVSPSVQAVNVNVLQYAPCSIGILVDNGFPGRWSVIRRVAVYFLGGADDREALAYAMRMAKNAAVGLTVVRFLAPKELREEGQEERMDDKMLEYFQHQTVDGKRVVYKEQVVKDGEETVAVIRETSPEFSLLIVGRREGKESLLTSGMSIWREYPELGVIGDLLASTNFGGRVSTLVVQQQVRVTGAAAQAADGPKVAPTVVQVVDSSSVSHVND
nr:PREDICTED: cation/H(+) antiporter 15-like [Musa acuminata subsp. malaccensis]